MTLMFNSVFQVKICTWNPFRPMVLVQMNSHVKMQNNCLCVIIRFIVEVVPDKKENRGKERGRSRHRKKDREEKTGKKGETATPFLWGFLTSRHLILWVRLSMCDSRCTHKIQRCTAWTDVVCWNLQSTEIPAKTKTNKKRIIFQKDLNNVKLV